MAVTYYNKIVKNTLVLYSRMFLVMAVKLYTSRVILHALGIDNYGIYNVVGGVVVLFDFINNAMTSSTQRYITFEVGKGDLERLNKVFITSINIHLLISVLIVFLSETIGLYILLRQMNFPAGRFWAAFWVYQISIVTAVINIMSLPYSAMIIAQEKMSVFAYITIFEVFAKLGIAFLIMIDICDKLILYALLIAVLQILIRFLYSVYCSKKIYGTKYHMYWNSSLIKEMTSFAGWNLLGNMAGVLATQGQNIILNIFFGPVVNAARAVAIQVQSAIFQFSVGFQTAINPQITKSFANDDLEKMHSLIFKSSKLSFLALFVLCIPFFIKGEFILQLWLEDVPEYSMEFLKIILLISLLDCSANSLMISAAATGKVKKYQIVCGSIVLAICPITYLAFKFGYPPLYAFLVHLGISCTVYGARLILLKNMILLNINQFLRKVVFKCFIVILFTYILIFPFIFMFGNGGNFEVLLLIILSIFIAAIVSYFVGLNFNEKQFIHSCLLRVVNKFKY